jgi:hypothetical protein
MSDSTADKQAHLNLKRKARTTSQPFIWMGMTRVHLKAVRPQQTLSIPVSACFFHAGTFNLNEFRVFWKESDASIDGPSLMTYHEMSYLLTVADQTAAGASSSSQAPQQHETNPAANGYDSIAL